jgi:hypothetical protein
VSRTSRFAIAACWLVVAFLLLRMAWGGSLFGIIYVLNYNPPAVLIAGGGTIVGALGAALLVARRASHLALWISIAIAFLAIPLSVVLATEDHGSAPAVGAAAVIAMALSLRGIAARPTEDSPPS